MKWALGLERMALELRLLQPQALSAATATEKAVQEAKREFEHARVAEAYTLKVATMCYEDNKTMVSRGGWRARAFLHRATDRHRSRRRTTRM